MKTRTYRRGGNRGGARRTTELQFDRGATLARLAVSGDGARAFDHDHDARTDHDERAANERFDSAHHDESGTTTTTTAAPSVARSATGTATNYSYGILAVKVTVSVARSRTSRSRRSTTEVTLARSTSTNSRSPSSNNSPERPERQYPRRLRCQLHDRRVRAVAPVGALKVGTVMRSSATQQGTRKILHHDEHVMGTIVTFDSTTTSHRRRRCGTFSTRR